ncbi:MAG: hypothetical protein OEP95_01645 [Myxococcales bacterium]|nr:hypothetical protein [Myxococcales bacterium]
MRRAVLAIGALVGAVVLAVLAIDLLTFQDDEVITLVTFSPNGDAHETPLWVVESSVDDRVPGELWVRARSPNAEWLARLTAVPRVEIEGEEANLEFLAEPFVVDAEQRERVNDAMSEKYGAAYRMTAWLADPSRSVPIRLRPASESLDLAAPRSGDR